MVRGRLEISARKKWGLEVSRNWGPEVSRKKWGPEVCRKKGPGCRPILLKLPNMILNITFTIMTFFKVFCPFSCNSLGSVGVQIFFLHLTTFLTPTLLFLYFLDN